MRKVIDRQALIALVGISAGMLSGCGPSDGQWRVCTDNRGHRLPDGNCHDGSSGNAGPWGHSGGSGGGGHWLYVPRTRSAPAVGAEVRDGSVMTEQGHAYFAPSEGIVRGGFGRIGASIGHAFGG